MRAAIVLCALCGVAQAQPAVDNLQTAKPGDWTTLEGQRREGDKLVPDRVTLRIAKPTSKDTVRIAWFRGAAGKETHFETTVLALPFERGALLAAIASQHYPRTVTSRPLATAMTCKFAREHACTRLIASESDDVATIVTLSPAVDGTGIAGIVVTGNPGVLWDLHTVGYGHDRTTTWGVAAPRLRDPPEPKPEQEITGDLPAGPGRAPLATLGQPTTTGGELDKAIIRRYLKRNFMRIEYCYEKQLLVSPKLAGTVVTKFDIGLDGKVSSSKATGVDPTVSSCIATVIERIEFPHPKGDKPVSVTYPIAFKPST